MRRLNLILVLVLLGVPAAAPAKVGVDTEKDPQALAPGEETGLMVMVMRDPGDPMGEPAPIVGVRPLVSFRNEKTGEVVRVRAGRTGRDGTARATVAFPSRGEWQVGISGVRDLLHEPGQTLPVGIDVPGDEALPPEVVEPPVRSPITDDRSPSLPTVPLAVGLGLILLAAAALFARRERPA